MQQQPQQPLPPTPLQEAPHLLAMKVMRLSRPSFGQTPNQVLIAGESELSVGKSILNQLQADNLSLKSTNSIVANDLAADHTLSNIMVLPNGFGNIYLGETFSSYICINNDSDFNVSGVAVRVELHTSSSQRLMLLDSSANSSEVVNLLKKQTLEHVVTHEIKELGVHILVCNVQYTAAATGNVPRSFRKYYKFQVSNPLSVKTKVNSTSVPGVIFLEAQIQNVSTGCMVLERVRLDSNDAFLVQDMNFVPVNAAGDMAKSTSQANLLVNNRSMSTTFSSAGSQDVISAFGDHLYLQPQDTRQYLFRLTASQKYPLAYVNTVTVLGKLDIVWRTAMGEQGRLQTSPLQRKQVPNQIMDWTIVSKPDHVAVEELFSITFRAHNTSRMKQDIVFSVDRDKMISVVLAGDSVIELGSIEPGFAIDFNVDFYALSDGIARFSGMKMSDKLSNGFIENPAFEIYIERGTVDR